jgi:tmRNA-binding protein
MIFLSKACCKKRHGLCKNIKRWTQKRSKIKKKEEEKEMRIKISHVLAKIFSKR